ncbi:uncharacterized protein BDV17DRAFT_65901 [Aspergillus undulatus]|uniref:uncharacterized protein n=1 Tax=Aspergillus undulatus TaxID=1810928 RepID=UPI003CCD481C
MITRVSLLINNHYSPVPTSKSPVCTVSVCPSPRIRMIRIACMAPHRIASHRKNHAVKINQNPKKKNERKKGRNKNLVRRSALISSRQPGLSVCTLYRVLCPVSRKRTRIPSLVIVSW